MTELKTISLMVCMVSFCTIPFYGLNAFILWCISFAITGILNGLDE